MSSGKPPRLGTSLEQIIADRPRDVLFVLDQLAMVAGLPQLSTERVGICGHSFGGWTSLTATARDRRIAAVVPLAPAGGSSSIADNPVVERVELDWGRDVPSLFIVAERDSLLPLEGMRELFARTAGPKKMVVLRNAGHLHFCDRPKEVHELFRTTKPLHSMLQLDGPVPPFSELCSGEVALLAVRGLALAHFDAHLRHHSAAKEFVENGILSGLSRRGVDIDIER